MAGATNASYATPPVVPAMNGAVYSLAASNASGSVLSSNATLKVLSPLGRTLVWNDEFNGTTIDGSKWQQLGDYSCQQGYWLKQDSYLNGQGQLVLRVMQDQATGHYGAGAVQGNYQRTFGYFEAKVKFPTQPGHWCAFWLFTMSQGSTNVIGGAALANAFTTPALWAANSGWQYYVVVTNALNAVTSSVATVTVPQAQFSPPTLSNGTNLVVTWTGGGLLQSATNMTGPWTLVTNATSPFTSLIISNTLQQFFRVQQ